MPDRKKELRDRFYEIAESFVAVNEGEDIEVIDVAAGAMTLGIHLALADREVAQALSDAMLPDDEELTRCVLEGQRRTEQFAAELRELME